MGITPNEHIIDVDIKRPTQLVMFPVTQFDNITFRLRVFDKGKPVSLAGVTLATMVSVRQDGRPVTVEGSVTGENEASFNVGNKSTAVVGRVSAVAQFYDEAGRVSTIAFSYLVNQDPMDGTVLLDEDRTLIEVVLQQGPLAIGQAFAAAEYATAEGIRAGLSADGALDASDRANKAAYALEVINQTSLAAEMERLTNESDRQTNETKRTEFEAERDTAEASRKVAETARQAQEVQRQADTQKSIEDVEQVRQYVIEKVNYVEEKKPLIDRYTDEQTNLQTQLNDVIKGMTVDAELIQARGGYKVLNERLDDIASNIDAGFFTDTTTGVTIDGGSFV